MHRGRVCAVLFPSGAGAGLDATEEYRGRGAECSGRNQRQAGPGDRAHAGCRPAGEQHCRGRQQGRCRRANHLRLPCPADRQCPCAGGRDADASHRPDHRLEQAELYGPHLARLGIQRLYRACRARGLPDEDREGPRCPAALGARCHDSGVLVAGRKPSPHCGRAAHEDGWRQRARAEARHLQGVGGSADGAPRRAHPAGLHGGRQCRTAPGRGQAAPARRVVRPAPAWHDGGRADVERAGRRHGLRELAQHRRAKGY
jgi:hypothetical protein